MMVYFKLVFFVLALVNVAICYDMVRLQVQGNGMYITADDRDLPFTTGPIDTSGHTVFVMAEYEPSLYAFETYLFAGHYLRCAGPGTPCVAYTEPTLFYLEQNSTGLVYLVDEQHLALTAVQSYFEGVTTEQNTGSKNQLFKVEKVV